MRTTLNGGVLRQYYNSRSIAQTGRADSCGDCSLVALVVVAGGGGGGAVGWNAVI